MCVVCGKPLPDIRGGRKTHAGFCTKVRKADYMRVYMRERYRKKKEQAQQAVPPQEETPPSPPVRMTLDEFAAKARSEGKTYGQLRAEMLLERMKGEKR